MKRVDVEIEGFDRFESIGSGGSSHVYRARQVGFDRLVAVKVLNIDVSSDDRRRTFERECRALGALSEHPNIVTVLTAATTSSAGVAERRPCIVMELYSGGTLADRVRSDGPLDVEEVLRHGVLIGGALQTAHDRGVVHRDVKPQNLFVSDYGQPALGDFGISSFEGEQTVTGAGGGLTVHYAPPEVLEGCSAGARSDVYSLAATLYFLASGERPFPRAGEQTMSDVARRILVESPPRLGQGWPESLADLLQVGMAKRPDDRPCSAEEFARALQGIQRNLGLPVTALPVVGRPAEEVPSTAASGVSAASGVPAVAAPEEAGGRRWSVPGRVGRSWMLAGVAVLGLGASLVVVATSGDDPGDPGVATSGPSTTDVFFSVPAVPTGMVVERSGDTVTVRWDEAGAVAGFQVERMDALAAGKVVEVTEPVVVLSVAPAVRPCVTVVAVGGNGRLSLPSAVICDEN